MANESASGTGAGESTGGDAADSRPISVSELLARSRAQGDTAPSTTREGRGRRRVGREGSVSVSELTGEIPRIETGPFPRATDPTARRSSDTAPVAAPPTGPEQPRTEATSTPSQSATTASGMPAFTAPAPVSTGPEPTFTEPTFTAPTFTAPPATRDFHAEDVSRRLATQSAEAEDVSATAVTGIIPIVDDHHDDLVVVESDDPAAAELPTPAGTGTDHETSSPTTRSAGGFAEVMDDFEAYRNFADVDEPAEKPRRRGLFGRRKDKKSAEPSRAELARERARQTDDAADTAPAAQEPSAAEPAAQTGEAFTPEAYGTATYGTPTEPAQTYPTGTPAEPPATVAWSAADHSGQDDEHAITRHVDPSPAEVTELLPATEPAISRHVDTPAENASNPDAGADDDTQEASAGTPLPGGDDEPLEVATATPSRAAWSAVEPAEPAQTEAWAAETSDATEADEWTDLAPATTEPEPAPLPTAAFDTAADRTAADHPAPEEVAQPGREHSPIVAWLLIIGQALVGLAIGVGLFWGFTELWKWNVYFALVLAVLVIFGIVTFSHVVRRTRDLPTTLLALAVGLIVTIGPLVLLAT